MQQRPKLDDGAIPEEVEGENDHMSPENKKQRA
jgi:hypothetical protein